MVSEVDRTAADTAFSGVVRVDVDGEVVLAKAFGMADRAHSVANTVGTRIGVASGGKAFTALTVMRLIEDGLLELSTTARSVLGTDLPLIGDDVTVEHLLAHRSGIGDYLDEDVLEDITEYVLPVPVHALASTEDFVKILDGFPPKFQPDEQFSYCNGGYVVLALIAERAAGEPYHDLVGRHVCDRAGMSATAFLRSDELPGDAAIGYLAADGLRSNVFHLPVRATGDGGIHTTAADVHTFWEAFFAGRIVGPDVVAEMVGPRSDVPEESARFGLGFMLHATTDAVYLVGSDAGASFQSVHQPTRRISYSVLSNTSEGAWPVTRRVGELLGMR